MPHFPLTILAESEQQKAVLRALNENASSTISTGTFYTILGAIAVALILVLIVHRISEQKTAPAKRVVIRNPRKLLREIASDLELNSAQLRKLEHHAERLGVDNALTLLLCPSLIEKDTPVSATPDK